MSDILSGMRAHEAQSLKSAILALDAALAAREPVYVQGCDELRARTEGEHAAYMEGLEEGKKIAARQPVGEPITVEAVAEIFNHPEYGLSIDWLLENGIGELQIGDVLMVSDRAITDEDGSGEVYTAPPAQAVDLGQFRRVLLAAVDKFGGIPADATAAEKLRELLALIDSHSVASNQLSGKSGQLAVDGARQPVGEQPMEMRICELRHVSLKPNRPYVFTVDANCANCRADAAYAMGHTDTRPAHAVNLANFKALYRAYVRLLESGRDRIRDLGGTCDPVDVMEANDVDLQAARRVLDSQAVANG